MGKASRRKKENRATPALMDMRIPLPPATVVQTRTNLPMEQRVSVRLHTLLEDLLPGGLESTSLEKCKTLLDLVTLAWNISVLGKAEWDDKLNEVTRNQLTDEISRQEYQDLLRTIITRKIELYPGDQRFIVSWELTYNKNKFSISAAALNPPGQAVV